MGYEHVKKRNWAFIVYPESAPDNWKDHLRETGLPVAISPLHEFDVNAQDGEVKKAHYHVLLHYDGPTSYNVVERICKSVIGTRPVPIESLKGQYRYLTHQDNPEKYQYDPADICLLNGFSINDYAEQSRSEVNAIKKRILAIVRDNDIYEYADLLDYLDRNDLADEFDVAASNTILFNSYITSKRNKAFPSSRSDQ